MAYPNPFDLRYHRSGSGGDLVKQFLSTFGSHKTRRNYRTDLRQFFGGEEVLRPEASRIQKGHFIEFLRERAHELKRTSLKRKVEAVRSFFRWVAEQNLIEELPIKEKVDTGDLVDQVMQETRATTEVEGGSRTADEPEEGDEDDSRGSPRGRVPKELEPGSEVDLDRETDSNSAKSSSPGSRPELRERAEDTPDSEHTESLSSEASSSEKPRSGESSSDRPTGSAPNSDEEGPPKEESVEERDAREEPVGEGRAEGNSADENAPVEDSDGEDSPSIPHWAIASGNVREVDLRRGEYVALAELPDALCYALRKLIQGGVEGLFLRCTNDLKVQIRPCQDETSRSIGVRIEHRAFESIIRTERSLSEEPVLREAIVYLAGRAWALPRAVYDDLDALPNPGDAEGPFSEKRPKWRQEGADDQMVQTFVAAEITGTLAEGFGIGKDEEVFLGA